VADKPPVIAPQSSIRKRAPTEYTVKVRPQFILGLVLLSNICQGQVSAAGTLVAVVPANGGIIIAADTRTTVPAITQTYCDGRPKLFVPSKRKNIVVFETGAGIQSPPWRVEPPDICGYVRETTPILDINTFIVQQLETNRKQVLTQTEMQVIAEQCVSRVVDFARTYSLKPYFGQNMFRAVIVSYDAKRETGLLGSFVVMLDSSGKPMLGEVQWHEFVKAHRTSDDVKLFGETEYVDEYVSKLGQSFLGPCKALTGKTVSQTSLADAKSAALSIITATEETAKSVPPPHGIGGPIDVATITKRGTVLERH
jgi:hypothetical protein